MPSAIKNRMEIEVECVSNSVDYALRNEKERDKHKLLNERLFPIKDNHAKFFKNQINQLEK